MNLYDLKTEEKWQEILDNLCRSLDMPTALVDPHSFVLQESGERHDLCAAIRADKDSLIGICAKTQKFMSKEALRMDEDEVIRMAGRVPVVGREKVAEVSDRTFDAIHSGS